MPESFTVSALGQGAGVGVGVAVGVGVGVGVGMFTTGPVKLDRSRISSPSVNNNSISRASVALKVTVLVVITPF